MILNTPLWYTHLQKIQVAANYIQQYIQFLFIFLKTEFYSNLIRDKLIFSDCIKIFCTFFATTSGSLYILRYCLESWYSCILRWWWSRQWLKHVVGEYYVTNTFYIPAFLVLLCKLYYSWMTLVVFRNYLIKKLWWIILCVKSR